MGRMSLVCKGLAERGIHLTHPIVTVVILIIVMSFQINRRTPTKRGTKRGERSEPERVPGCTFEFIGRYDDPELRASTDGVITVRDAGDQTVEADMRAKRGDPSRPPSPDSDTQSRWDIASVRMPNNGYARQLPSGTVNTERS